MAETVFAFPSKSKPGTYHHTLVDEDGNIACQCTAAQNFRDCWHIHDEAVLAESKRRRGEDEVYIVFANDSLGRIFHSGEKAVAYLNEVKQQIDGEWERIPISETADDPYSQRWAQVNGPIARLSVERYPVV